MVKLVSPVACFSNQHEPAIPDQSHQRAVLRLGTNNRLRILPYGTKLQLIDGHLWTPIQSLTQLSVTRDWRCDPTAHEPLRRWFEKNCDTIAQLPRKAQVSQRRSCARIHLRIPCTSMEMLRAPLPQFAPGPSSGVRLPLHACTNL